MLCYGSDRDRGVSSVSARRSLPFDSKVDEIPASLDSPTTVSHWTDIDRIGGSASPESAHNALALCLSARLFGVPALSNATARNVRTTQPGPHFGPPSKREGILRASGSESYQGNFPNYWQPSSGVAPLPSGTT